MYLMKVMHHRVREKERERGEEDSGLYTYINIYKDMIL
jgi:hypothetical protein